LPNTNSQYNQPPFIELRKRAYADTLRGGLCPPVVEQFFKSLADLRVGVVGKDDTPAGLA
jgi:hypothetical protein